MYYKTVIFSFFFFSAAKSRFLVVKNESWLPFSGRKKTAAEGIFLPRKNHFFLVM